MVFSLGVRSVLLSFGLNLDLALTPLRLDLDSIQANLGLKKGGFDYRPLKHIVLLE